MKNSYDEIKDLLGKVRVINEDLEKKNDRGKSYNIDGNTIILYGKKGIEQQLEEDERAAFVDTINDFNLSVSRMSEFYPLNLYEGGLEWSGKIIDHDIEFIISLGTVNAIYTDSNMNFVDDDYIEVLGKLKQFFEKFKEKWLPLIGIQSGHEK